MYLYAIKDLHSGLIKLGYSIDPRARVRELQTGSSSELSLIYSAEVSSNARLLEGHLHTALNHLRVRGEWFRISEEQAKNFISWCVIHYDCD